MSDTQLSAFATYKSQVLAAKAKSKKRKSNISKKRKLKSEKNSQDGINSAKKQKNKKVIQEESIEENLGSPAEDLNENEHNRTTEDMNISDASTVPKINNVEVVKNGTNKKKGILVKEKSIKQPKKEEEVSDTCESPNEAVINFDSIENGKKLFSWVISPSEDARFFKHIWEKRPLLVKRHCATYYSTLLSSEEIDKVLRQKTLFFTKNVDVTSYTNGQRETHNPEGRANAPVVWDYYNNGCSIRLLNPQTFFHKVHLLNATLQEFFGCLVGANVYLTPPGTQGFAPHYDDIEAFILQIEGKKHWKLYVPRCSAETLPRFSSGNLNEEELEAPIAEYTLEAGDMLYFPRGTIHQGQALEDTHSLHLTLSVYQKTSWADLLEKLLPAALKVAVEENLQFRRGLPLQYLSYMGVVHSDESSQERTAFMRQLQRLIEELFKHAPIDAAVDQLGKEFVHDSLPPVLKHEERCRSVFGDGERMRFGRVSNQAEIGLDTRIKLLRRNALRLVQEDEGTLRLYYSVNNSREYHADEPQFLEIGVHLAAAVDALIKSYPSFLVIEDLPLDSDTDKVQIASDLWEHGLLLTDEPLGYTSE